ncbi:ribosome biogenesis protein [Candidatus Woesearchaeota archaeon]|nr:ribosome biogenesis protein [Candidatus Woesearchaeota archaeon]
MKHILKCPKCREYTMKEEHCGEKTLRPQPAKWSPEDKYGKYRLEARKEELRKRNLI